MMSAGVMQKANVTKKIGFLQQELLSRLPSETELWGTLQNTMHALPKLTMPQDFDKSLASYADSALIATAAHQVWPNITMPQDFDKNVAAYVDSVMTAVTAVREGLPRRPPSYRASTGNHSAREQSDRAPNRRHVQNEGWCPLRPLVGAWW